MNKNIFQGKNTALFDLDGTLVETKPIALKALKIVLNENNLSFVNESDYFVTGGCRSNIWRAIKIADAPNFEKSDKELTKETQIVYRNLIKETDLEIKEGFWDLFYEMKEVRKYKTGLTTNSERDVAEIIMAKLDLKDIFDFSIFGDDVKRKKPNPQMYKRALKSLKSRASKTIVFEDSLVGAEAANKAGIDIIIVWDGTTPKYLFPKRTRLYIHNFTEVAGTLDETKFEHLTRRVKEIAEQNN